MLGTVRYALFCLTGGALLVSLIAILPSLVDLPLFLLLAGIFTMPGWPIARWFAGAEADRLTRTVLALPFGLAAGSITYAALRLVGVSSPFVVLAACAGLGFVLAWAGRRRPVGVVTLTRLDAADGIGLSLLWLLAVAIVGPVFARVGEVTPAGLAYRAYFNADLFVHMSVVAELAKGATPPLNPFLPVEAFPYYWTYFTLPALFAQLRPALPVDSGIMLTDVGMAVMFVGVGFLVVRNLGPSARAAAISWATILLASSFEGAYLLWDAVSKGTPLASFRNWNVDAVTRWVWNLPGVDGLHRGMWWTPQHLMALTLALILVLTMARARRPGSLAPAVLEGVLLGAMVATSSFNGVLMVASYGIAQVAILAAGRGQRIGSWLLSRSVSAVIVAGFLGLTLGLGMVQQTPGAFLFGWNRYFLRGPWTFILLSFGPALFLAPLGARAALKASRTLVITLAAIIAVIAAAFLLVDLRGHENTQVTFRTGHLLYVCLAILLAFAIDAARSWSGWRAAAFTLVLALGAAAAVPTVALDWYNARDITNVEMGPGRFPWTVHISPDDGAAARWIHRALPADATVQTDALPRERYTWAFVTAFARRRMAVGNGLFTLNPTRYLDGMRAVHDAFSVATPEAAHASLVRLGVDYVYIGDVERRVNGEQLRKFAAHPRLFQFVYSRGSVEIFRVVK